MYLTSDSRVKMSVFKRDAIASTVAACETTNPLVNKLN